jgi:formylglycine-generating enzyme required for sulfatase activity
VRRDQSGWIHGRSVDVVNALISIKSHATQIAILVIGTATITAGAWCAWSQIHQSNPYADKIRLIRQLAVSDETHLVELLEGSTVRIPAGEFVMGSDSGRPDERPPRLVYLDAFEIDRYEVTNAQYYQYLLASGANPPAHWIEGNFPFGQADYPLVGIRWQAANDYCTWAGKRLPSEAEWEKACRGTDGRLYPWGDKWDARLANVATHTALDSPEPEFSIEKAWEKIWQFLRSTLADDREAGLRPVGSYPAGASPYGVMDLVGNASEWVFDWYNWSDFSELPSHNPIGTGPPWNHSLRGSSWFNPMADENWIQNNSRCAACNSSHSTTDSRVGFRCARSP